MADFIEILRQGADAWNRWRKENPSVLLRDVMLEDMDLRGYDFRDMNFVRVRLVGADLGGCDCEGARFVDTLLNNAKVEGANLSAIFVRSRLDDVDFSAARVGAASFGDSVLQGANFSGLDLTLANFSDAHCSKADFSRANLSGAAMQRADCNQAKFTGANLRGTDLIGAMLHMANFDDADLTGAQLLTAQLILASAQRANFTDADMAMASVVNSDFTGATFVRTKIYGLSAWNVALDGARQEDLVITRSEPAITCDDIELAQFIHLLLENAKVRKVIDTVTSKVVLILGRFTEERKAVLDALREALRKLDKTPILFDFDKPSSKDILGTVETLARMSRFIIADLTDPSSVPMELMAVIPAIPTTPVLPILLEGRSEFSMFNDLRRRYPWVMPTQRYRSEGSLIETLPALIAPADAEAERLRGR